MSNITIPTPFLASPISCKETFLAAEIYAPLALCTITGHWIDLKSSPSDRSHTVAKVLQLTPLATLIGYTFGYTFDSTATAIFTGIASLSICSLLLATYYHESTPSIRCLQAINSAILLTAKAVHTLAVTTILACSFYTCSPSDSYLVIPPYSILFLEYAIHSYISCKRTINSAERDEFLI